MENQLQKEHALPAAQKCLESEKPKGSSPFFNSFFGKVFSKLPFFIDSIP
jgi:hypothetical protein